LKLDSRASVSRSLAISHHHPLRARRLREVERTLGNRVSPESCSMGYKGKGMAGYEAVRRHQTLRSRHSQGLVPISETSRAGHYTASSAAKHQNDRVRQPVSATRWTRRTNLMDTSLLKTFSATCTGRTSSSENGNGTTINAKLSTGNFLPGKPFRYRVTIILE
jgi:hypothetical protein